MITQDPHAGIRGGCHLENMIRESRINQWLLMQIKKILILLNTHYVKNIKDRNGKAAILKKKYLL